VEETADQMRPLLQAAQDAMGAGFQVRLYPGRAAAQFPLHMRPSQLVGVQVGLVDISDLRNSAGIFS
jgi:hypothetical protein